MLIIKEQSPQIEGEMVVSIDIEGYVTHVNSKACEVLGYSEDEILGKHWFNNFIPDGNRKEIITVFKKIMRGDIEFTEYFKNPILASSGEEKMIVWHNKLLKDDKGNNVGTVSAGKDISGH